MPDPRPPALQKSIEAWRNLGMKIASITPKQLGRMVLGLIALGAIVWIAIASWPALLPFVVGGVIAYTVLPLVDALDKVLPRFLAALIGVLIAVGVLAGVLYVVGPPLVAQLLRIFDALPGPAEIRAIDARIAADPEFRQLPELVRAPLLGMVTDSLTRLRDGAEGLLPALLQGDPIWAFVNTIAYVLGLIVLPTWALALLKDQPRAWPTLAHVLPAGMRRDARAYVRIVDHAFGTFLRGQIVLALAVGLLTYAGLSLIDRYLGTPIPSRLPLAVLAGFLELIPEVGPMLNIIGAALLALLIGGGRFALEIVALYAGVQWLVSNLLGDRFSAKVLDVHPAVLILVIVALTQLGSLWFFLAAPIAAVARDTWRYTFGRLKEPSMPAGLLPAERVAYERRMAQQAVGRALPAVYRRR